MCSQILLQKFIDDDGYHNFTTIEKETLIRDLDKEILEGPAGDVILFSFLKNGARESFKQTSRETSKIGFWAKLAGRKDTK